MCRSCYVNNIVYPETFGDVCNKNDTSSRFQLIFGIIKATKKKDLGVYFHVMETHSCHE